MALKHDPPTPTLDPPLQVLTRQMKRSVTPDHTDCGFRQVRAGWEACRSGGTVAGMA